VEKRLLIADAGPLIALAKVSRLQLLAELFPAAAITDSVRIECLRKRTADARVIQRALSDNRIVCIPDPMPAHHLMKGLGQGELSCIQLALQDPDSKLLLLDDALARREAYRKGVRFIGTAMLLYLAEKEGFLDSAEEVAEQMSAHGYRISVQIFEIIRGKPV
jgi:predicted nucleic acid-binding protein